MIHQIHNLAYNLNRNLWAINTLATEKLQIRSLQKTFCIDIKMLFQLVFFPNACEVYSRNIYIHATVDLTNHKPTLMLHKWFLGFNLTYMNITYFQFMQFLNVTKPTPEQIKHLTRKLPNYTIINYDSLKEQMQQINENYPYSMLIWFKIFVMMLDTLIAIIGIVTFLHCNHQHTPNKSDACSIFLVQRREIINAP